AFGLTTASPECVACDFALRFISILLLTKAEGLGCAVDQFPKRDRPKTSPLSSSQQPMDHVFLRGHSPPKSGRPLPSAARIEHNSFYPAGGCVPRRFFKMSHSIRVLASSAFRRAISIFSALTTLPLISRNPPAPPPSASYEASASHTASDPKDPTSWPPRRPFAL